MNGLGFQPHIDKLEHDGWRGKEEEEDSTCKHAQILLMLRERERIIVVINIQRGIYMLLNGFAFAHLIPSCTKQTRKLRTQWKWGIEVGRREGARSHGELCVIQNAIRCFTSASTLPEDGHVSAKHLNTLSITNMSFGARATVTSAISGQSSLAHATPFRGARSVCVRTNFTLDNSARFAGLSVVKSSQQSFWGFPILVCQKQMDSRAFRCSSCICETFAARKWTMTWVCYH